MVDPIQEGLEIPPLAVHFSAERNGRYCRLVNEINPLHYDAEYARALGYRDIVIAGVFTASYFPELLDRWLGRTVRIEKMVLKFRMPAYLDDTVTYRGRVTRATNEGAFRRIECDLWSENASGERLAQATVTARLG